MLQSATLGSFSPKQTEVNIHSNEPMDCDSLIVPQTSHVTPKKKYVHQFWHPKQPVRTSTVTNCPTPNKDRTCRHASSSSRPRRPSLGRIRHPKNKTEDFRRVCSVCTLPADYYNSGAISCESCKMFFRRNFNKLLRLQCVTMRNKSEDTDSATHVSQRISQEWLQEVMCDLRQTGKKRLCALCRLKQCFIVGMRPIRHCDIDNPHGPATPVKEVFSLPTEEAQNSSMFKMDASDNVSPKYDILLKMSQEPSHSSVIWRTDIRFSSSEEDEEFCGTKATCNSHEIPMATLKKLNSVCCRRFPDQAITLSIQQQKCHHTNGLSHCIDATNNSKLGTSIFYLAESDAFLRIILETPKDALLCENGFVETDFRTEMTPALRVLFCSQFVMPREHQKSSWGSLRYLAESLAVRTVEFCRHMMPLAQWSTGEKQSVLKTRLTVMVCYLSILFADAPYSEFSWTAALGQYRAIVLLLQPLLPTIASLSVFPMLSLFIARMNEILQNDLQLRLIFLALKLMEVLPSHKLYFPSKDLYNACLHAFQHLSLQLWRGFLTSASTLPLTKGSCAVSAKVQSQRWLNFCQLYAWSRHHFDVGCIQEVSELHTRPEMGDFLHLLASVVDHAA